MLLEYYSNVILLLKHFTVMKMLVAWQLLRAEK